ncbi:MAG: hypothetical protein M3O61_02485 [Gemmatimonadota bacterium]|nr:hypothetical protein [Gemmatimonadota bacterium]
MLATDPFTRRDDLGSELVAFARFLGGLPRLVRRRMTLPEALVIVKKRLRSREANFITVLQRSVFANPTSPYRALLSMAGCTLGDVRELVSKEGLEGTLHRLRHSGVYVSFEEFKGVQPIVRGSLTIETTPADFDNPGAGRYYSTTTGGSTGTGRRVQLDLEHMEALLPGRILVRHVHGVSGVPAATWSDLPPGGGLKGMLLHAAAGEQATHWFCAQPVTGRNGPPMRYRLATRAALRIARMAGAKVSWPRYVPFDQAVVLAQWAADQVQRSGACTIQASVSRILRIAIAATTHNIDLTGTVLRGGGEPPTPAKVTKIVSTGAIFRSSYAFSEIGPVGSSCVHATGPNDQHFMQDHLAMIQAARPVPGFSIEVPAFCFTSLLTSAPKLLLNVESDDYGTVDTRPCGCEWETLGFPHHIRDIRSFRKLTGEGVTLVGSDIERILDDLLPAHFGGSALDYQFAEEEDERGFTRLTLRVAPTVVLGDEAEAVEFVLRCLERAGGAAAIAQSMWRQAGTLRIRREAPTMTRRGKVMPLDIGARAS